MAKLASVLRIEAWSMERRVVICGGGTGGHINPGLAVAHELAQMEIPVSWLGCTGGMEDKMVGATDISFASVRYTIPKAGLLGKLGALARLARPAWVARDILAKVNAGVVLGLGGYPSLPGVIATLGTDIKRVLHEQNILPGAANRLLAPIAHQILTSSKQTFPSNKKARFTGNPVRDEFATYATPQERFAKRSGVLKLLVIGGSQGATSLNEALPLALATKVNAGKWEVEHAAGSPEATAQLGKAYAKAKIKAKVADFFDDIAERMATADLMVCRAGASTIAELACIGLGAIMIPYPHAGTHQRANATEMVAANAALQFADESLAEGDSLAQLLATVADRSKLLAMAQAAKKLQPENPARKVAHVCAQYLADV